MTQHSQNGEGVEVIRAKRLKYYPDYIEDAEGLERFRQDVLTHRGHDMAKLNHNSLGRLIDTIERLRYERDEARQSLARDPATADVGRERWRERWYGSEPQKGSAIVDERGNLIVYLGGDEETHRLTTAIVAAHNAALSRAAPSSDHSDDAAVDRFAAQMKAKLAKARAKGRGGWDDPAQCSTDHLRRLLHDHLPKGDPIDVANFCMMLAHYGASTAMPSSEPAIAEGERAELQDAVADALNAAYDVVESAADDDPASIDPSDLIALGEALGRVSDALPGPVSVGRAAAILATTPPTTNDAIPAGMVRWDGGDSAPDDWQRGKPVRQRNGQNTVLDEGESGRLYSGWRSVGPYGIIAYTPKASAAPSAPATEAGEEA